MNAFFYSFRSEDLLMIGHIATTEVKKESGLLLQWNTKPFIQCKLLMQCKSCAWQNKNYTEYCSFMSKITISRFLHYHAFCLSQRFPEFYIISYIKTPFLRKRVLVVFIEVIVLDLLRWTIVWNFPTTTPYTPKRWTLIDLSVGSSNAFLCLAESCIGIPFCHVCIKLLGTSVFGCVDLNRCLIQASCYWILK